jgi:hypothetical protein
VASQLRAEQKQLSQQTQPQAGAVEGEEVAAEPQKWEAKAARMADSAAEDADDDEEAGMTLSDKLEMFITYMLIAGVVGGLGILIYRVCSGGARPLTAGRVATRLAGVWLYEISPSRNPTRRVLSMCTEYVHGVGRRRAQRQPWAEAQQQRSATHQAGRHAFLQAAASSSS